jgi:hypothetical protein
MAATAGTESLSDLANDIGEVESKHTVVAGDEDNVRLVFQEALKQPQRRKTSTRPTSRSRGRSKPSRSTSGRSARCSRAIRRI